MANSGKSADYRLARRCTSGWIVVNGKWKQKPIKLPDYLACDTHQAKLKDWLYEYYFVYHNFYLPMHTAQNYQESNKWSDILDKIIRKMNQYRLKHWYWISLI